MSVGLEARLIRSPVKHDEGQVVPLAPLRDLEHLLKVAGSVAQDANKTWAELWRQLKPLRTASGIVLPKATEGFVPSCGWPEFLEQLWLLKHYIDSIQRLSENQR
ncbi:MAG TPA: hypothetical protein ENN81_02515 [Phycisphaerales bacterium]|nr:hypothetical protein [Phycisphaerales bacterium]